MAYDDETRYRLKRQICRSMPPSALPFTSRDGRLAEWFIKKLEGLAAYAHADKSGLKTLELLATQLHLVECRTQADVANILGIDQGTISRAVKKLLNCIIDQMPQEMALAVLQAGKANWRFGYVHQHRASNYPCVGALYWDPDVTGYAEWCCSECGYREGADKAK